MNYLPYRTQNCAITIRYKRDRVKLLKWHGNNTVTEYAPLVLVADCNSLSQFRNCINAFKINCAVFLSRLSYDESSDESKCTKLN